MISLALLVLAAAPPQYDLLLTHARVIDGTGAPWFRADVAVKGDRIAAVGDLSKASATKTIDLYDRVLAPGFIDMLGQSETAVLIDNRLESKLRQGFTTEVNGEGNSIFPMDERWKQESAEYFNRFHLTVDWTDLASYRKRFEKNKSTLNFAMLIGAGAVRAHVVGYEDKDPDARQLAAMEAEVEKAMQQGAFGLGTSLIYPPDRYAKTPELIALAKVAAHHGGFYASHIRSEADDEDAAVDEALQIGREANLPVEIWHLKCAGKNNQGKMKALLDRLEKARAGGLDVSANIYPYDAAMNGLESSLPSWAEEGGNDAMLARLKDADARKKMSGELFHTRGMGVETPEGILLTASPSADAQPYTGMRLSEAAKKLNKSPAEALLDLVQLSKGNFMVVRFVMNEDDVRLALQKSWVSLDTDMWGQATDGPFAKELAHPRAFGTTPRVLGHYVRELGLLSLEDAVRKMTSLPARRLGLGDRGLVRPGMAADLVVFDPAAVKETSTFEKPLSYPEGISHVVVNGKLVLDEGKLTNERPGRLLWHGR